VATNFNQLDPNADYGAKQAQQNLSGAAPSWYDRMINSAANSLRTNLPNNNPTPGLGGSPNTVVPGPARAGTADGRIGQLDTAAALHSGNGARTATGTSAASPPTVNDPNNASLSSGAALTPGLRRYAGQPGVYSGRSRDGSLYFTDDPNSQFTKSTVDPNGLRRSDINVGSYSNTPTPNDGSYGAQNGLPARAGTNQMAGDTLYANMTGQGDPNAGRALPANALNRGVNGQSIDTSAQALRGLSYGELQNGLAQLDKAQPANQDEAMANAALRSRLQAHLEDLRQGDAPGAFPKSPYGIGTGAYGAGGVPPGVNPLEYMRFAADQQHNQQELGLQTYQAQTARAGEQQRQLTDLEKQIGDTQDPSAKANLIFSRLSRDPAALRQQLDTPEGRYLSGQLDDIISGGTGGAYKGGGLRSLRFSKNDPNNFTIGRPNTMFPDENARTWYGSQRFAPPLYNVDNIDTLRNIRDILNPEGGQQDE
jgi:hypothetical protein